MADLKKFAEELVNLSVKEVSELAKILKDEYGIEPAAAVAVAGPVSGGEAPKVEEKQFSTSSYKCRRTNYKLLNLLKTSPALD